MPIPHAGLLSWRAFATLALCMIFSASAVGCVAFTDDVRPPEQMTIGSHNSMSATLATGSEAPDSVTSVEIPAGSFLSTSADDPIWGSVVATTMLRPCLTHVATRQAPDEADRCGEEKLMARTAFLVRDDVTLRPPTRQLWLHHPRLVPLKEGESSVSMPPHELS
jgi:hypothetical protein